jgi:VWFA-related protein
MILFSFRLGNRPGSAFCCFGAALFSLCLTMGTRAQQATPTLQNRGQQASTLSITTREVLLDVVVTDKDGHPVSGLAASDFAVMEEGDPQHIAHVEEHHPMDADELARLKAAPALPPNTFTNYTPVENTNASTVILLDALDARLQTQMELRQQLIDYLKHMQPGTPVAIFRIDTDMRLIQGFSSDPRVLLEAAKSKRNMPSMLRPVPGTPDEYRLSRFDILHAGFQLMGRYLAGFPGRKNLIWLTGSVPQSYYTDPLGGSFGMSFRDDIAILGDNPDDLTDALTLSRVAVYPIDARGLLTPPQFEASNNRGPAPNANLRFEAAQASQHTELDIIAKATGGKAYYNSNGLKDAIAGIVNNGSNYYTLAYATTNKTWDGRFRHIKVTVDRPGLRVQHRQGYYAVDRARQEQRLLAAKQKEKARAAGNPFGEEGEGEAASGETPPASGEPSTPADTGALVKHPRGGLVAAMQLGAITPTEVIFTASLAMDDKVVKLDRESPLPADNYLEADYKTMPFRTYTVQIQADARALRLRRTADGARQGTVETVTIVYDQTGDRVNSLITTAALYLSEAQYRKLLADGLRVRQEIAVPVKGNYFLRVGVHDVASDRIGALEIPVDEVRTNVSGQGLM